MLAVHLDFPKWGYWVSNEELLICCTAVVQTRFAQNWKTRKFVLCRNAVLKTQARGALHKVRYLLHLRCKLKHGAAGGKQACLKENLLKYQEPKQPLMVVHSCTLVLFPLPFLRERALLSIYKAQYTEYAISNCLNYIGILHLTSWSKFVSLSSRWRWEFWLQAIRSI